MGAVGDSEWSMLIFKQKSNRVQIYSIDRLMTDLTVNLHLHHRSTWSTDNNKPLHACRVIGIDYCVTNILLFIAFIVMLLNRCMISIIVDTSYKVEWNIPKSTVSYIQEKVTSLILVASNHWLKYCTVFSVTVISSNTLSVILRVLLVKKKKYYHYIFFMRQVNRRSYKIGVWKGVYLCMAERVL